MTLPKVEPTRKVGRPAAPARDPENPTKKLKLKPAPKDANKAYHRTYGDLGLVCIYGFDNYTKSLVEYFWQQPDTSFYVTDPDNNRLTRMNREIRQRSFSAFRWETAHVSEFLEYCPSPIIVVSKDMYDNIKSKPTKRDFKFIVLEEEFLLWRLVTMNYSFLTITLRST